MAYQNKTTSTGASVKGFIAAIEHDTRRQDAETLLNIMRRITAKQPKMWGPTIIGFDSYHYTYDSGHEGEICMVGFSPRKSSQVLYISQDFEGKDALMKKLGKYKTGKSCLYINKLADINQAVLEDIILSAYRYMKQQYG